MTQQINGMVRERLINCDTHFDNDQIEAVMAVIEDSGYSDLYEACKTTLGNLDDGFANKNLAIKTMLKQALSKAEGK